MEPVDAPGRGGLDRVRQSYRAAEVIRCEPRPAAEGAETKMDSQQRLVRHGPGQFLELGQVALDRALNRQARSTIDIGNLKRAIELNGKLRRRDNLAHLAYLGDQRLLKPCPQAEVCR